MFTAGIGTLLFQFHYPSPDPDFSGLKLRLYRPIMYSNQTWGLPATLGGLVAAGVMYILLSLIIRWRGPGFIQRLLPPVVVGPVIMVIGLGLGLYRRQHGDGQVW
ncbi:solute carrier family 23 protein [Halopseudomonas pachastrellae]|nr:solute carrier family 23 protein [Halopseudomonas pachastrellae]